MPHYSLPGVQLDSEGELLSFAGFECWGQSALRTVGLRFAATLPPAERPLFVLNHKEMDVTVLEDGWRFSMPNHPEFAAQLSKDRSRIVSTPVDQGWKQPLMLPFLRTAIECASAPEGVVSLHSACVEMDGEAVCFTASSGTGKSTRAKMWVDALGAEIISGDRPSVKLEGGRAVACGVPWDGKERIYRNVQRTLKMICEIVRSDEVSARRLTRKQARQLLMQQCFIPMWDDEAAVSVMAMIRRLIDRVPIVQLRCGPDEVSARAAYDLIYHHPEKILEETET